MQELISIIIPIYNVEKYIDQCLDSVINQSYQNIEIICVDDGSTDASKDIIKKYSNNDDRIKYFCLANSGVSAARNYGIQQSQGSCVMFVDGDDWIEKYTCEVALNEMVRYHADVVMWSYVREYEHSSLKKHIFTHNILFENDDLEWLKTSFAGYSEKGMMNPENMDALSPVWGKLYRREVIADVNFIDLKLIGSFEDGLFNLGVFQNVNTALYINQYFNHYRRTNSNSITNRYNPNLVENRNKLYSFIREYIQKNALGASYKRALENRIVYEIIYIGLNEFERNASFKSHCNNLKKVVGSKIFEQARIGFDYSAFSLYWKLFFYSVVHHKYIMMCGLLYAMYIIRKARK